jgi:hypothetical protein
MPKTTKTPAPTPAPAAPGKAPGVIAAIIELVSNGGGKTFDELYAGLVERFPDRARAKGGIKTTLKIQLKRLPASGKLAIKAEEVAERGVVYSVEPPAAG